MPGFKYGTANQRVALCARMGCSADATRTITVSGLRYRVCKRHGR